MEVDLKKEKQKILIKALIALLCLLLIGGGIGAFVVLSKRKPNETAQIKNSEEESTEEYVMEEIPTGVIEDETIEAVESATIVGENGETLPDLSAHADEIETVSFSGESIKPTGSVEYVEGYDNKLYFDEQGNLMFVTIGNPQMQFSAQYIEEFGGREKFIHEVLGK